MNVYLCQAVLLQLPLPPGVGTQAGPLLSLLLLLLVSELLPPLELLLQRVQRAAEGVKRKHPPPLTQLLPATQALQLVLVLAPLCGTGIQA
jgi:hypothetical protein